MSTTNQTVASKPGHHPAESRERILDAALKEFSAKGLAGELVLRGALSHFDRVLTQREFQKFAAQEMIRLHKGGEGTLRPLVKQVFRPLRGKLQATVQEGIVAGEMIDADWMQFQLAAMGANLFYFLSTPVWRMLRESDPFSTDYSDLAFPGIFGVVCLLFATMLFKRAL